MNMNMHIIMTVVVLINLSSFPLVPCSSGTPPSVPTAFVSVFVGFLAFIVSA